MNCMKCGREIGEEQVFCPDCLAVMERYPVKASATVVLPVRREPAAVKRVLPRHKTLTPEEQLRKLRRNLRVAVIGWCIAFLLFCAALYPAALYLMGQDNFGLGQNYSVIGTEETTGE